MTYTNPFPCSHLLAYKLKHPSNPYKSLQSTFKTTPYGRTSINIHKTQTPFCTSCSGCQGRLYYCLICCCISCHHKPHSNHALLHTQIESGHDIAVDMETAELYCFVCNDQVYDPDFDKAVIGTQFEIDNGVDLIGVRENPLKKRKLGGGLDCNSGKNSRKLVLRIKTGSSSSFPWGLRGLNNLGNTCFMNSVLQALLHTPPLRNYFLGGRQNHDSCRRNPATLCLHCDMEAVFNAVYSGDRTPYSPARFLYSWWQHSANLACYEQQDAHEFFISVLDRIHETEEKFRPQKKENGDCQCIAHKVFSGVLRSDVTCMTCGFTSTTYDPCLDISLNLETAICPSKKVNAKSGKTSHDQSISTLLGCLDLFTRPEKLGSDQKLYCQHCQVERDSFKQMSIRRLPLVLCFHIKRFEHSWIKKMSRKIDKYLQFPVSLDTTPYLSSSVVRKRFGNRIFAFEGDEADISTEFEVLAVVTHSGSLESGHYITYLRLKEQWYKCDDAWITQVSDHVVRAAQGYLLYYVQKAVCHKASEDLSCLPQSAHRDPFLPTPECC